MINLALKPLEIAINRYLLLDPDAIEHLKELQNKIIKIEISDWDIVFYIEIKKETLNLLSDSSRTPDSIIKGKLFDLIRVGYHRGDSRALFKNNIDISGQTEVGEKLRDVLQNVDIDWEEYLSKLTNDVIAHKVSFRFKQVVNFGRQTLLNLTDNVKEYVHHEDPFFPTSKQLDHFYREVSQLRNDVDRLEARVIRLQNKHMENKDEA